MKKFIVVTFWLFVVTIISLASSQETIYDFSTDFSSTQGEQRWYYLYGTPGNYKEMVYQEENAWFGNEKALLLRPGIFHPGNDSDAILGWITPEDGTWRLTGTVADAHDECGDGVMAEIWFKGSEIWQVQLDNGDKQGQAYDLEIDALWGDEVVFLVSKRSEKGCDATSWSPKIELK